MSLIVATLQKDLARWRQDISSFLTWLAIPFLIGGLITLMMDGDGGGPNGVLLIDDQDQTLVSGFVAGAFSQDQLGDLFTVRNVDATEGLAIIEDGGASAFLTIPAGFQDAFFNETPLTVGLKTNPSQTILPGIAENVVEVMLDAGFYLQALFADEISRIRDTEVAAGETEISNAFVAGIAVEVNEKMQLLGPYFFPPLIELNIEEPPAKAPRPDIGLLFLPGIVLMAVLFASQGLSGDYWRERADGTLRRLTTTPSALSTFVLGKAMAAAVVLCGIAGATLLVGFLYHGIAWVKFLPSILWVVVAGVGFFAWFAALQMFFSTEKGAGLLTSIMLFPLLMMGGSFFPLDVLPDWLAAIGRFSPNGYVVDRLTAELTATSAWTFSMQNWGVIILMTLSGLAACSWRLRTVFARGQ